MPLAQGFRTFVTVPVPFFEVPPRAGVGCNNLAHSTRDFVLSFAQYNSTQMIEVLAS